MSIKESLEADLREAMREGKDVDKRTIRMVIAAIKMAEIERGAKLDDPAVIAILQKEIKSREETIAEARKGGREQIASDAAAEILVLQHYLPRQLSDEDLRDIVLKAVEESGAAAPADMGKVMKLVMPQVAGRASGDRISQMVRQILVK